MGCKECKDDKKLKILTWKHMRNFLTFLYQNIKSGFKQVSFDEYHNRLNLCRGCMFYNHEQARCNDCGCYVKNKAKFKTEECPQGFWRKTDVRTK